MRNQTGLKLYVAKQQVNWLTQALTDVHAVIRDMEMQRDHYGVQRNCHIARCTTANEREKAVHTEAAGVYDTVADDLERRIAQLKQATKLR